MDFSAVLDVIPFTEAFELFKSEVPLLVVYALGMAVYGIFIWHFYRQLATRDIMAFDISKYKRKRRYRVVQEVVGFILYIIKYAVLFPLFSFFWFAMLAFFLFFLSKSQSVEVMLVIAITLVSATRMLAYYSEDISKDVAKLIPFTLLGVFLVDPGFFSFEVLKGRFVEIPSLLHVAIGYLIFVVVLEMVLRLAYEVKVLVFDSGSAEGIEKEEE